MRSAHQGVPVAGLPGLAGGVSLASAVSPAGVPISPGPGGPPQRIDRGLDGWFLDRLFGRH
jgi:hypothetical protein